MKYHQGEIIERLLSLSDESYKSHRDAALEDQIRNFINEIPGGFIIYSANESENILYVNKALLNIFKCANFKEFLTLTGGSFRGAVHPEDYEEVERSIAKQITESPDDMDFLEHRIVCKDGTVRRVENYGHFAHTESGDYFYVFIRDATEKINRRLQERVQRYQIIEGLCADYDSIFYFDLENDTALPYRLSNRMREQFSSTLEVRKYNELIKEYIFNWVHPDDRTSVSEKLSPEYMSNTLADIPTYYFNYRCIENGEVIHLQLRVANVGMDHSTGKFVFGFRRIDEEILREVKQKQILEDALKASRLADVAKNTFLANMSHDMRTPLNAIFGFSSLAKRDISDQESVKYYLDRIEEASRQILELTEQVLEASDTKTQDAIIQTSPCDLSQLLDEIYHTTREHGLKKGLDVTLNVDGLEHHNVLADRDKIKNTLWYLTGNAVKFNKEGGKVEIVVTEKPCGDENMRTYRFAVKDTGVGINSDILAHIFEPFEREQTTTESGISGAGLGLTLAKHNAELMGGDITVESEKGAGSTFTLTLNLKLAETDERTDSEVFAETMRGLKVLIVDDNEINMEIAMDILQDAGFVVDTATNGKIAVDKIKDSPIDAYDFVLMDIQMPVMDGRQATDEIRALDNPRSQIPIIALSANALERDKRLSIEHGMNAYLTKPMDLELIIKTFAEILHSKKK